jgi:hypothetical protein
MVACFLPEGATINACGHSPALSPQLKNQYTDDFWGWLI